MLDRFGLAQTGFFPFSQFLINMKKHVRFPRILSVLSILLATFFLSFYPSHSPQKSITQQIQNQYISGLSSFEKEVNKLLDLSKSLETEEEVEAIQIQYYRARNAYKSIEFLLEYFDAEFVKLHINGAPLPRLSNDDTKSVEEPEGLQTLEELIFSDDPSLEQKRIYELGDQLAQHLKSFVPFQKSIPLYHRHVFEASRSQIIRIFALSLTGFDTPGTVNGIEESKISLQSVHKSISLYYPLLNNRKSTLPKSLEKQFSQALDYLKKHDDFDKFDRLYFLKAYLNPLYSSLLDAHKKLGIETKYEANPRISKYSTNYSARNIFSDSLINPFFYTEQTSSQHTDKTIQLGKLLFFDPILSDNLDRSCASCHQPNKAFTDGQKKSIARNFEGTVDRNAPTLINASLSPRYFYDLRALKLESQIHHVVFNEKEFNSNFFEIFKRLKASQEYVKLFQEAFPQHQHPIHQYTLTAALSSYVISLNSFDSPFDQYVRGESDHLEESAKRGFNLFMGKAACGTCHFAPTFNGLVPPLYKEIESEILGVPASADAELLRLDPDPGRYIGMVQEQQHIYRHSFKTVSVRNAALTAPYMHNGVFASLDEVMDFYNRGGGEGLGYEVPNQTLPFDSLALNQTEIKDIISFMNTLTDTTGLTSIPRRLPAFPEDSPYANRTVGGKY